MMKWWVDENIRETPTELQQAAFICTNCGSAFGGTGVAHIIENFVYCPYCGIRLDGEPKKRTKEPKKRTKDE